MNVSRLGEGAGRTGIQTHRDTYRQNDWKLSGYIALALGIQHKL
jgi:hypothetical protein